MQPITIIGADLSLTETGICRLRTCSDNDKHITLTIKAASKGLPRLHTLREQFARVIEDADVVIIEDYAFAAAGRIASIAEWGGIARMVCFDAGVKILTVPPTTLKKYVTGRGNAKKDEMLLEVYKRWGQSFRNDNMCDAYALAKAGELWCHANGIALRDKPLTVAEKDTASKIIDLNPLALPAPLQHVAANPRRVARRKTPPE